MHSGRKSSRHAVSTPAMIYDAAGRKSIMSCSVVDLSATGAKLKLSKDEPLPASFLLSLTPDGSVLRPCKTAWQLSVVAGVRFAES